MFVAFFLKYWRDIAWATLLGIVITFFVHKGYKLREDVEQREVATQVKHNEEIKQNVDKALAEQKKKFDEESLAPVSPNASKLVLVTTDKTCTSTVPSNGVPAQANNGVPAESRVVVGGDEIEEHFIRDRAVIDYLQRYIQECIREKVCKGY